MFEKFPQQTKKEVEVERPKAVKRDVNLIHLVNFVSTFFPKIIYHCNMLNHYRKVNKEVGANMNCNCLYIDADFAENLKMPVKHKLQSLHWAQERLSVHSDIIKCKGNKSYHPYFWDSRIHDQVFVNCAINEILQEVENIGLYDATIVESDNCASQYKSAQHFNDLHQISN